MEDFEKIIKDVNEVVEPYGCHITAITEEDAVAVKGDQREVGPGVIIAIPEGMNDEKIAEMSTTITNRVRCICRVLVEIEPKP